MNSGGMIVIQDRDGLAAFMDKRVVEITRTDGGWTASFVDGAVARIEEKVPLVTSVIAAFAHPDLRFIPRGFGALIEAIAGADVYVESVSIESGESSVEAVVNSASAHRRITLRRHAHLQGPSYSLGEFFEEIGPGVQKFAAGRSLAPVPQQFFRERARKIVEFLAEKKFEETVALPPLLMTVGITDQCNFKCEMCFRTRRGYVPNRFIFPADTLRNLILDMAEMGMIALRFCGEGENMLHPQFLEALLLARVVGLRTFIITNGTQLHLGYKIAVHCLDYLRVSFNALDPGHYLRTHGITSLDTYFQVLKNLKKAREERDWLGSQSPILTMSSVICRDAISDAAQARLAQDLSEVGIDFLTLKADRLWEMNETEKQQYRGIISYMEAANIRVTDYSGYTSPEVTPQRAWEDELGIGCAVRLMRANIDQFDVHSCVTQHEVYGNIINQRLPEIWSSAQRSALQRRRAKSELALCDKCFWGDFHRIMNHLFEQEAL